MFFYDFPNLLAIFIVIIISLRIGLIPLWLSFFRIICSNTLLFERYSFPASYIPDQFQYFNEVRQIRSFNFEPLSNFKLQVSNWILAIIPLPYVETIKSLGFFNRLVATVLTIWFILRKICEVGLFLFILFYPSFLSIQPIVSKRHNSIFVYDCFSNIIYRK